MSESVNPSNVKTHVHTAPHPVAHAIDKYLESTRDISLAARMFIPAANKAAKENAKQIVADFNQAEALLAGNSALNRAQGLKLSFATIRKVKRLRHSRLAQQLENSLFINLFSSFDVFTGELVAALHNQKPDLFHRLNRNIPLASVLSARSIEVLKRSVLDEEIETIRRKSYSEQFEYLEKTFDILLRKFDKWAYFVEAGQRRNLLTHCGGIVIEQYRNNCISADYPLDKLPTIGTQIGLGAEYFFATCELMH